MILSILDPCTLAGLTPSKAVARIAVGLYFAPQDWQSILI
jgi:hypothetical protein